MAIKTVVLMTHHMGYFLLNFKKSSTAVTGNDIENNQIKTSLFVPVQGLIIVLIICGKHLLVEKSDLR